MSFTDWPWRHWRTRRADKPALRLDDVTLSWTQLGKRIDRLAAGFQSQGVADGDGVMLLAHNHPQTLLAWLALLQCGARILPVNPQLPRPLLDVLLPQMTNNEVDQELHYLDLLRSYQVEGIVVNAVGMREEGLNRLQQSSLPMVLIDRKIPEFACDVVGLDNTQAATTATEHLIEQGFEAILFLSEPLGMVNTRRDRLSAFRATLARYPGVIAENAEIPLHEAGQLDNTLRQFHTRHRGMRKAVISANGALTLQVARSLKRIGLHWGSDIGLLGFDELEWAELAGVGITTLKQPTWQIGYAAVEQVVRRIEGTRDAVREQVFSGELIVRGSTAR